MELRVTQMPAAIKSSIRMGLTVPSRRQVVRPTPTHYPYTQEPGFQPSKGPVSAGDMLRRSRIGEH